ncbi:MAG: DUF177 domain-containing protein [Candidatus Dadabacteria bacterium]|nr:MAG: DUF177 domain-containing protein [Candidatus Dadabacteria bacterium]
MIVKVSDLSAQVKVLDFFEDTGPVNALVEAAPGWAEQRLEGNLAVHAEIYRHGRDVTFVGNVSGTVWTVCPRCLDEFRWRLDRHFEFLIAPAQGRGDEEDDMGLAHYSGDEIDLSPLVREQAILALDQNVRCSESCRGLCPGCGVNLNHEPCRCGER